jgi:hypothetical protein
MNAENIKEINFSEILQAKGQSCSRMIKKLIDLLQPNQAQTKQICEMIGIDTNFLIPKLI